MPETQPPPTVVTVVVHLDAAAGTFTVHFGGPHHDSAPSPALAVGLLRAAAGDVIDRYPGINGADALADVLHTYPMTARAGRHLAAIHP